MRKHVCVSQNSSGYPHAQTHTHMHAHAYICGISPRTSCTSYGEWALKALALFQPRWPCVVFRCALRFTRQASWICGSGEGARIYHMCPRRHEPRGTSASTIKPLTDSELGRTCVVAALTQTTHGRIGVPRKSDGPGGQTWCIPPNIFCLPNLLGRNHHTAHR